MHLHRHPGFNPLLGAPHLLPAGLELLAFRGSVAHNMYTPKEDPDSIDDVDLIGIVIPEAPYLLGLHDWGSRGTREVKQEHWDMVFYDLRKAIRMLLLGNPNILTLLWLKQEHYLHGSEELLELISQRHLFVGKHVWAPWAGYANDQLQRMVSRDPADLREYLAVTSELKYRGLHPNHRGVEFPQPDRSSGEAKDTAAWSADKLLAALRKFQKKGENIGYMGEKRKQLVLDRGYDSKNAAHCIRLLKMAREFLQTGEMVVYRTDDRSQLLAIKNGAWTLDEVKSYAEQLEEECRYALDRSPLPEQPDRQAVERLVVKMLRRKLA